MHSKALYIAPTRQNSLNNHCLRSSGVGTLILVPVDFLTGSTNEPKLGQNVVGAYAPDLRAHLVPPTACPSTYTRRSYQGILGAVVP